MSWPGPCSIIGLLLGGGYWLLDAVSAALIFNQGSLVAMLVHPEYTDLWLRFVVLIVSIGIGIAADIYLGRAINSAVITNRNTHQLSEEDLLNSEARLRRYFEAGVIGMAVISPDMKLIQINDKYCEITGYSRAELLGMSFTAITHPDDREVGIDQFERARAGKIDGFEVTKRYIRKDGRVIYVVISTKYVYSADGSMAYGVGFVQDITDQKIVERELRERESRLREAQRIARLGFWEWDLVRGKILWSDELYVLLDLEPENFLVSPDSLQSLIHPDDRESFYRHFDDVLENDVPFKHEHRMCLPNGTIQYHRVQGEVIRDASGLPLRTFGTVQDITEQKLAEKALQLYEHIVNASSDAMAIIDTDYRYVAVNQHYLDAFKVTRPEVIGRYVKEIIGQENFESFAKYNINRTMTGVSSNMQGWSYQPGFGKRYLDIYGTPLREANGRISGVVINAHDITERKLAEDELRRSEELLRRFYEAGSVGMALSSPGQGFFQFNDTFCEIIGYPRDAITGISWKEITHPDDRQRDEEEFASIMRGETDGFTLDKRVIRQNGDAVYITTAVNCARRPDGNVVYFVTFVQDITERKQAEQALIKSEEKFAKAVQSTMDVVNITRLSDGLILFTNDSFTRLSGFTRSDWVGKTTHDLNIWSNPEDRERLIQSIDHGELRGFETEVRHKEGGDVPVSMSASLIEIDGEECMVTWVRDLREAKRAERERQKLEQQLFQSQKMEAIGQLTGGIAHDFNNILASILGYANLAVRCCASLDEPKLVEYLTEVIHGGERARDLIQQMMTYSRSVPNAATRQALQPLVENAIKLLRPMLPSSIVIQAQLPVAIPDVLVDPAQLEQIIMNLCINARDAINGGGSIELELCRAVIKSEECASCHEIFSGDYVVLTVKDSGSGVPERIIPLIFDPFFTTKDVGHGTGMGLSMVHGIMHNGGGHILLESSPARGAKFSMLFPVKAGVGKLEKISAPRVASPVQIVQKHGLIMVVDDEPVIARYLGELLNGQGYRTMVLNGGQAALSQFQRVRDDVDLVITDQTMPDFSGVELAIQLLKIRPDLPIILNTGYSEVVDGEIARAAGISAFFTKPLNETLLLQKLDELLAGSVELNGPN